MEGESEATPETNGDSEGTLEKPDLDDKFDLLKEAQDRSHAAVYIKDGSREVNIETDEAMEDVTEEAIEVLERLIIMDEMDKKSSGTTGFD